MQSYFSRIEASILPDVFQTFFYLSLRQKYKTMTKLYNSQVDSFKRLQDDLI